MTPTGRALLIQNAESSTAGLLPDWLSAAGWSVELVPAYAGAPVPRRPSNADAVILLGGGLLPDEDEDAPWLADERDLALAAHREGVAVLGICLGGQLVAYVHGGKVRGKYGTPERGVTELERRPESATDAVFADLPERFLAIESHQDAIVDLPPEATWLASSADCPYQAFRVGERTWGVQFHPEADPDRIRTWDPAGLGAQGFDRDEMIARADASRDELDQTWRGFVGRFLEVAAHGTA